MPVRYSLARAPRPRAAIGYWNRPRRRLARPRRADRHV